jgi:NADP-dependent 3-hydroxy acid dehydrogenase YdfG
VRTTVISPSVMATELSNSISEPDVAQNIQKFYQAFAIPAESFAPAGAAINLAEDIDVNEILFWPTRRKV